MAVSSSVETHPQRQYIDVLIVGGMSLRKIGQSVTPPVSPMVLQRYKKLQGIVGARVKDKLEDQKIQQLTGVALQPIQNDTKIASVPDVVPLNGETEIVMRPHSLRERQEALGRRIERALDRAEKAVDVTKDKDGNIVHVADSLRPLAPLMREAHRNIELQGAISGELAHATQQTVAVQIVTNHFHAAAPPVPPVPASVPPQLETVYDLLPEAIDLNAE